MQRVSVLVAFLLGVFLSGCVRAPTTLTVSPSALYVKQICPSLSYDVIGKFDKNWTGFGFLGQPTGSGPPNINAFINAEVARLKGDAAIDVKVETSFLLIYALFWANTHPKYHVTGNIIRYQTDHCRHG